MNVTSSRAIPAGMGGMPFSVNRASERHSATSSRSPCTTCRSKPGLLVGVGRERLRGAARDRRVAVDQLLDDAAHRLEPERQRHHVEQQHVVAAGAARQHVGLHRRAQRDHLIGIDVAERLLPEQLLDEAAHQRHPRRAADEDHARQRARARRRRPRAPAARGAAQRSSTGATSASISARVRRSTVVSPGASATSIAASVSVVSLSLRARAASSTRRTHVRRRAPRRRPRARAAPRRSRDRSRRRPAPSRRPSTSPRTRRPRA